MCSKTNIQQVVLYISFSLLPSMFNTNFMLFEFFLFDAVFGILVWYFVQYCLAHSLSKLVARILADHCQLCHFLVLISYDERETSS